jgi:hypothetical protein
MTMNQYLPSSYIETVWRLAAGIIPVSALGGTPPLPGVRLALERVPKPHPVPAGAGAIGNYDVGIGLPTVARNDAGRFAITYSVPGLSSPVAVRLCDTARRYVPRRFRLPVPAEAAVVGRPRGGPRCWLPWPVALRTRAGMPGFGSVTVARLGVAHWCDGAVAGSRFPCRRP